MYWSSRVQNASRMLPWPLSRCPYRNLWFSLVWKTEQFWLLYLQKDIVELEKMQKRAIQVIKGLKLLPVEERLKCLWLLLFRKLIEKVMDSFSLSSSVVEGHSKTLFRTDKINYLFLQAVINLWNSLLQDVVMAPVAGSFEKGIWQIHRVAVWMMAGWWFWVSEKAVFKWQQLETAASFTLACLSLSEQLVGCVWCRILG